MKIKLLRYTNAYFGWIPKPYKRSKSITIEWRNYGLVFEFNRKLPRIIPTRFHIRKLPVYAKFFFLPRFISQTTFSYILWLKWEFAFGFITSNRTWWRDWSEDDYKLKPETTKNETTAY